MTTPSPNPPARSSTLASWLERLVLVRPGEGRLVLLSSLGAFLLFASYNLIRPMRDEVGAALGTSKLPWLMSASLLAMVVASPCVSWLVARFDRRVFIPAIFRYFVICLAGLTALLLLFPHDTHHAARTRVGVGLFVLTGVFNLLTVSLYWGFLADIFRDEQARRLFGVISVGGTTGAIAGAGIASILATRIPTAYIPLLAAAILEASVWLVLVVDSLARRTARPGRPVRVDEESPGSVLDGFRLILHNRYLAGIAGYMLLFAFTSTVLYFEQAEIVGHAIPDVGARTAIFAQIDLYANVLTLLAQLFLTGRVIDRLGVGPTLVLTPLLTAAGLAVLLAFPSLEMLILIQVLRRGLHYAVDRPAREVLYTTLAPDERYKSKSFIDTFIYRAGDLLGAWFAGLLPLLGLLGVAGAIPLSLAWGAIALWLGRRHHTLARPAHAATPAPNPPPAASAPTNSRQIAGTSR